MPKIKTNKAVKKRVRVSAGGKYLRRMAGKSHLLSKRSRKRKRQLKRPKQVSPGDRNRLRHLLGMG